MRKSHPDFQIPVISQADCREGYSDHRADHERDYYRNDDTFV